MSIIFDKHLFIKLVCGFVAFTIVGTLCHEMGHYLAAVYFGYDTSISYGYTHLNGNLNENEHILIIACGILQTVVTGIFGLIWLLFQRKNFYASSALNNKQWLIIFISLFWLRELFNCLFSFCIYIMTGKISDRIDEINLAVSLHFDPWSFLLPLATVAVCVLMVVLFRFIPQGQRFTFVLSLLLGGPLGYYTWMKFLGPLVLP